MAKNGDRVTKVHDLPDDLTHLKKIRSVNHPDRNNPDSDHDLYQAVVEKIDRMRLVSAWGILRPSSMGQSFGARRDDGLALFNFDDATTRRLSS